MGRNQNMSKERLTHGQAKHRRETLAKGRKEANPDVVKERVTERQRIEIRLQKINGLLEEEGTDSLTPQQKSLLEIERFCLDYKLEKTTLPQFQSTLDKYLNKVERERPEDYTWLTKLEDGITPVAKIRREVFPPTKIAGYYTRRG